MEKHTVQCTSRTRIWRVAWPLLALLLGLVGPWAAPALADRHNQTVYLPLVLK